MQRLQREKDDLIALQKHECLQCEEGLEKEYKETEDAFKRRKDETRNLQVLLVGNFLL
jgi:hypothetical protein